MPPTRRINIVMVERTLPKRVDLPDGRTFCAHYKKVNRADLPANVIIGRTYGGRPVRGRQVKVWVSVRAKPARDRRLGKIIRPAKKVVRGPLVKELGKVAFKELPGVYNKATSKIKNKIIKELLQLDLANSLVDIYVAYGHDKLNWFVNKNHIVV